MTLFFRGCKCCVLYIFVGVCVNVAAYVSPFSTASELRKEYEDVCVSDEATLEFNKNSGTSIIEAKQQIAPGEACYVGAGYDSRLIRAARKNSDGHDTATNDSADSVPRKMVPSHLKEELSTFLFNALSSTAHSADKVVTKASDLVLNALSLIGVNYRYGGNHPSSGLDCSGFVRYVVRDTLGFLLPRRAIEMSKLGEVVAKESLQPGDLVFFNTMRSAFSHVGIYIGDNKFVHAPSQGKQIRVDNMHASYWSRRYNGARRVSVEVISDNDKHLARLRKQFIDRKN